MGYAYAANAPATDDRVRVSGGFFTYWEEPVSLLGRTVNNLGEDISDYDGDTLRWSVTAQDGTTVQIRTDPEDDFSDTIDTTISNIVRTLYGATVSLYFDAEDLQGGLLTVTCSLVGTDLSGEHTIYVWYDPGVYLSITSSTPVTRGQSFTLRAEVRTNGGADGSKNGTMSLTLDNTDAADVLSVGSIAITNGVGSAEYTITGGSGTDAGNYIEGSFSGVTPGNTHSFTIGDPYINITTEPSGTITRGENFTISAELLDATGSRLTGENGTFTVTLNSTDGSDAISAGTLAFSAGIGSSSFSISGGSGTDVGNTITIARAGTTSATSGSFSVEDPVLPGPISANRIVKFNGYYYAVGSGLLGNVYYDDCIFLVTGGNIYAGNGGTINVFDGSSWSSIGSFPDTAVYCVNVVSENKIYAGGLGGIYFWDGASWSAWGGGSNPLGTGKCIMALSDTEIYVGGSFTTLGGSSYSRIAKWDGSSWSSLGSGLDGTCEALAADSLGNIYAGGYFTNAGGVSSNRIAKWNGSSWSALGAGLDGIVHDIEIDGNDNLYVCGRFTQAGGSSAIRVAKWDGSSWSSLGSGINDYGYAIGIDSSENVYVGGDFTEAGGSPAPYIALWSGESWSSVKDGVNGPVRSITVSSDDSVYIGGSFTQATN